MFILISDLTVAQEVTFLQTLSASGTEDFLKTNHFCTMTSWLTPQGVPRWGHARACTTRCPWKTSNYFQHFKASKTRTPFWRRSIYPWEDFSIQDIQLGACHHFLKQVCWHREAQPRPWCCSSYQALVKHSTQAWGVGTMLILMQPVPPWKHWILCLWGGHSLDSIFPTLFSSVAVQGFASSAFSHLSCCLYNYIFHFSNSLKQ